MDVVLFVVSSSVLWLLLFLHPSGVVNGFMSTTTTLRRHNNPSSIRPILDVPPKTFTTSSIPRRSKVVGDDDDDEDWLQVRRKEYVDLLDRIDTIESTIQKSNNFVTSNSDDESDTDTDELDEFDSKLKKNLARLENGELNSVDEALKLVLKECNQISSEFDDDEMELQDFIGNAIAEELNGLNLIKEALLNERQLLEALKQVQEEYNQIQYYHSVLAQVLQLAQLVP